MGVLNKVEKKEIRDLLGTRDANYEPQAFHAVKRQRTVLTRQSSFKEPIMANSIQVDALAQWMIHWMMLEPLVLF